MNCFFESALYSLAVLMAFFTALGQVLLKLYSVKSNKRNRSFLKKFLNPFLILSVLLFSLSFIGAIWVMRYLEFTIYYSITALNFVFITFLSKKYLKEKIDSKKWVGIIIIVVGLLVFNL